MLKVGGLDPLIGRAKPASLLLTRRLLGPLTMQQRHSFLRVRGNSGNDNSQRQPTPKTKTQQPQDIPSCNATTKSGRYMQKRHGDDNLKAKITAHGGGTDMQPRLGMTFQSKRHAGKTLFASDIKMEEDEVLRLYNRYIFGTRLWPRRKGVPR